MEKGCAVSAVTINQGPRSKSGHILMEAEVKAQKYAASASTSFNKAYRYCK